MRSSALHVTDRTSDRMTAVAGNVAVECREGRHERCSMACGCECHSRPRALGLWASFGVGNSEERAKPLQRVEVPVGLHVVKEAS